MSKKSIYIGENRLKALVESHEEITFFSFFNNVKNFLKGLLEDPINSRPSEELTRYFNNSTRGEIIDALVKADILRRDTKLKETPKEATEDGKSRVDVTIKYSVPREKFKDKIHKLYDKTINESKSVFAHEDEMKKQILNGEDGETYRLRGGLDEATTMEDAQNKIRSMKIMKVYRSLMNEPDAKNKIYLMGTTTLNIYPNSFLSDNISPFDAPRLTNTYLMLSDSSKRYKLFIACCDGKRNLMRFDGTLALGDNWVDKIQFSHTYGEDECVYVKITNDNQEFYFNLDTQQFYDCTYLMPIDSPFSKNDQLNEHLDKYFGNVLKKYLFQSKNNDEFNQDEIIQYNEYWTYFYDFIKFNHLSDDFTEEELDEILICCDNYDVALLEDILWGKYKEYKEEFAEWLKRKIYSRGSYLPTSHVMDYTKDIKNGWLIHFSNNAVDIWRNGFQYATDEIEKLGYSNAGRTEGKSKEGFNFAYNAENGVRRYAFNRNEPKYGNEAVMFRANGVQATHYGDEEEQVVFYNKDTKDIVYIAYSDEYDWCLYGNKGQVIYHNEDIDKVINWVIRNFDQYRKQLVNRKEHKVIQNNNRTSIYNKVLTRGNNI